MEEGTQGAICLKPTGNLQGTYHFLSLHTGRKITRSKFTEVPDLSIVVKRVTRMAIAEKKEVGLLLENHNLVEIE